MIRKIYRQERPAPARPASGPLSQAGPRLLGQTLRMQRCALGARRWGWGPPALPSPGWRLELPSLGFRMSPQPLSFLETQPARGRSRRACSCCGLLSLASRQGSRLPGCHTGPFPLLAQTCGPPFCLQGGGLASRASTFTSTAAPGFPSLVPRGPSGTESRW